MCFSRYDRLSHCFHDFPGFPTVRFSMHFPHQRQQESKLAVTFLPSRFGRVSISFHRAHLLITGRLRSETALAACAAFVFRLVPVKSVAGRGPRVFRRDPVVWEEPVKVGARFSRLPGKFQFFSSLWVKMFMDFDRTWFLVSRNDDLSILKQSR